MYPNGVMPTSSTPLEVASKTSNGGTIAPPGSVSIFRRPADIFSTVSAHILKIRWKFDAAGCEDCPLRISGFGAWELAGPGKAIMKSADTRASKVATGTRIFSSSPGNAPRLFIVGRGYYDF